MKIKTPDTKKVTDFVMRLSDIRFAMQVAFIIIVLLVSWSGIKTIQANYSLQKEISAIKQKNDVSKLENDNLELQNRYYKSNQYLELAARQDLGLGMPGEKEIIVPASVVKNYTVNISPDVKAVTIKRTPTMVERNLSGWVDFFFNRSSSN